MNRLAQLIVWGAFWLLVHSLSGCAIMMRGPTSGQEAAWDKYQAEQRQTKAEAEAKADLDGDTVPDRVDNCPLVWNKDQKDFDQDGVGDFCDNCPEKKNPRQENKDADKLGDVCDPTPNCNPQYFNCGL
jgi:hypothetical protein